MLLVFASRTNNILRIVKKLNLEASQLLNISEGFEEKINQDFYLLTYTDLLGSIPEVVENFLKNNSQNLKGVAGSGNRNFGKNFCGAAKKISELYKVPILAKFDLAGTDKEIAEFKKILQSQK